MAFAICTLSSVSLLESPDRKSPRVYELLFAESVEIIQEHGLWSEVKLPNTDQLAWIQQGQYEKVEQPVSLARMVDDMGGYAVAGEDTTIEVYYGSPLPVSAHLKTDRSEYRILAEGRDTDQGFNAEADRQLLEEFVVTYLHVPYSYKGRTKHGLDSLGLCDLCYRQFGFFNSTEASLLAQSGRSVASLEEIQDADLLIFEEKATGQLHFGISVSEDEVLHVLEKVRIDSLIRETGHLAIGADDQQQKEPLYSLKEIRRIV